MRPAIFASKVVAIRAASKERVEDSIRQGIARAREILRNAKRAWIMERHVRVVVRKFAEYPVSMALTRILEDQAAPLARSGTAIIIFPRTGARRGQRSDNIL